MSDLVDVDAVVGGLLRIVAVSTLYSRDVIPMHTNYNGWMSYSLQHRVAACSPCPPSGRACCCCMGTMGHASYCVVATHHS